jgi:hypothetical protein
MLDLNELDQLKITEHQIVTVDFQRCCKNRISIHQRK